MGERCLLRIKHYALEAQSGEMISADAGEATKKGRSLP
jgi:hypothetical protein